MLNLKPVAMLNTSCRAEISAAKASNASRALQVLLLLLLLPPPPPPPLMATTSYRSPLPNRSAPPQSPHSPPQRADSSGGVNKRKR
jgi:hypothetical protein